MNIGIRPEHQRLIEQAIQSGAYQNPEAVVERALEVLRAEEDWLSENRVFINEKIDRALAQFERGECFTLEEVKSDMAEHRAKWLREHRP